MRTGCIITLGLLLAFTAQADLLTNGDFQTPGGSTPATGLINGHANGALGPGGWDVFNDIPGWTGGDWGIEVQADAGVAHGGNQWVELDSHGFNLAPGEPIYFGHNSSMDQNYTAPAAGLYRITFDYRIRTDRSQFISGDIMVGGLSTFAIGVFIDGMNEGVIDDPGAANWTMKTSDTFSLSDGEMVTIRFAALGWADSFGGLLDNISIERVGEVIPEPSTFVLVGFGLIGAYFIRRRRAA